MFPIRDHNHSDKFPLVTVTFIAINTLVFFYQLSIDTNAFVYHYALVARWVDLTRPSTWYPLLTSMFLHGGWLHIISNMWFLWIFGDNIEAALGHIKYLLFYLTSGIAASLVQFMVTPDSTIPMLGASGAIAGILGGYLVLFPHAKIETLLIVFGGYMTRANIPAQIMLFYWFVTQLFSGVGSVAAGMHTQGGVAFFAHVGGFVAGFLLMRLIKPSLTLLRLE